MARSGDGAKRSWRFRLHDGTFLEVSTPEGTSEKKVRRRGRVSLVLMTLAVAAILVGVAGGAVWTDQADYAPGSVVTISGDNSNDAGYRAGETVNVDVSGPNGYAASCQGTADENGAWSCQVTLWDSIDAVGGYNYAATGQESGVSESGTFTDALPTRVNNPAITPTSPTTADSLHFTGTLQYDPIGAPSWTALAAKSVAVTGPYATNAPDCVLGGGTAVDSGTTDSIGDFDVTIGTKTQGTYWYRADYAGDGPGGTYQGTHECVSVTVSAPAGPTADAGGPYEGDEGEAIQLDGSASSGTGTLTYEWSVDDSGINDSGTCTLSDTAIANPTLTCDDDGSAEVSLKVTDDNGDDTDTADVTVSNVAPDAAAPTVSNASNCDVSISASFTDDGTNDTHTASIAWGDSNTTDPATVTETQGTGTGTVSGSHTYAGPGTYDITVTVADDEGDSDTSDALEFDNTPELEYPLPPIFDPNTKTYKVGSTIPVKIMVTGCTAGLQPVLSIEPPDTIIKSSGKSNDLQYLRYAPLIPGYIYNWNTKGWVSGVTYTVKVSGLPPSDVVISNNVKLVK